jgi:hypothetical protein
MGASHCQVKNNPDSRKHTGVSRAIKFYPENNRHVFLNKYVSPLRSR